MISYFSSPAEKFAFVRDHVALWEGHRAIYSENLGLSLVTVGSLEVDEEWVKATITVIPAAGMLTRDPSWRLQLFYPHTEFRSDLWGNGWISLALYYSPELIAGTLDIAARLRAEHDPVDQRQLVRLMHSLRRDLGLAP